MAAADISSIDDRNFKITNCFNKHVYDTWEDHVLSPGERPIAASQINALAVLCILGNKFTIEKSSYEKLYFDLFCTAIGGPGDTYRQATAPGNRRPRLFKSQPSEVDSKNFSFIWPIAVQSQDSEKKDVVEEFYIGIPSQYLYAGVPRVGYEEDGALCTLLYLVMSDTVGSFHKSLESNPDCKAESTVEMPCLLGYFYSSPKNNKNNIAALIGEYLALLGLSFLERFHDEWKYSPVEKQNDFKVSCNQEVRVFSVKSCNERDLKLFSDGINNPSKAENARVNTGHAQTHDAILIVNCDCSHCKLNPVVVLGEVENVDKQVCKRAGAEDHLLKLYETIKDKKKHYIMSVDLYFDLRFALSTSWKKNQPEGAMQLIEGKREKQQCQKRKQGQENPDQHPNANLRCQFAECFKAMTQDGNPDSDGNICLRWIPSDGTALQTDAS